MPSPRPETEDVEETVAETEDGALVEVEALFPRLRGVDEFVDDVRSDVDAPCTRGDGGEDRPPRGRDHCVPVLRGRGV